MFGKKIIRKKTQAYSRFWEGRQIWQQILDLGRWGLKLRVTDSQMSNEKNLGCFGYVGDEILPSYIRDYNEPL